MFGSWLVDLLQERDTHTRTNIIHHDMTRFSWFQGCACRGRRRRRDLAGTQIFNALGKIHIALSRRPKDQFHGQAQWMQQIVHELHHGPSFVEAPHRLFLDNLNARGRQIARGHIARIAPQCIKGIGQDANPYDTWFAIVVARTTTTALRLPWGIGRRRSIGSANQGLQPGLHGIQFQGLHCFTNHGTGTTTVCCHGSISQGGTSRDGSRPPVLVRRSWSSWIAMRRAFKPGGSNGGDKVQFLNLDQGSQGHPSRNLITTPSRECKASSSDRFQLVDASVVVLVLIGWLLHLMTHHFDQNPDMVVVVVVLLWLWLLSGLGTTSRITRFILVILILVQ